MTITRQFNYDDIYLVPQKRIVNSRSECDISVQLGDRVFANPVIAANMKTVVDWKTCHFLASQGMFYIMHRYHNLGNPQFASQVQDSQEKFGFASVSIGVQWADRQKLEYLAVNGTFPEFLTIDVAHAHADQVAEMIKFAKETLPTFVIAGNVGTPEGVAFLEDAGADCVKVFIGPGAACTTKKKTGFTVGTVSCLLECAASAKVPLIADGGIRECGDIAKAMACGATMVMAGMFMCAFDESPGLTMPIEGSLKYLYYGSASYNMKRDSKYIEGKDILVPYKGSMKKHIEDIECSLKSACSYAGVQKISEMYEKNIPMISFKGED